MKLGGRRLVARRHSGVDAGVCGDGYRQIRPSVAGSCLALACGRRRGGGEGVSPPWRRSAGASVMPSCGTTPVSQNPDCHLKIQASLTEERHADFDLSIVLPPLGCVFSFFLSFRPPTLGLSVFFFISFFRSASLSLSLVRSRRTRRAQPVGGPRLPPCRRVQLCPIRERNPWDPVVCG